jgi:hypothetical protein
MLPPGPAVLTVADCAAFLGTTEVAIRARIRQRQLPFRRLGRQIVFLRTELPVYLAALPGCLPSDTLSSAESAHPWERVGSPHSLDSRQAALL